METAFIDLARDLMQTLRSGPLLDTRRGRPFSTERHAGDGVLRVSHGAVLYASPNAVSIMRDAGVEGRVTACAPPNFPGERSASLPCSAPPRPRHGARIAGRTLGYRSISLTAGALVLVDDLTEARRRERELGVEEATIRRSTTGSRTTCRPSRRCCACRPGAAATTRYGKG